MKLDGRRESTNVQDRRSSGGRMMAGGSIGVALIGALIYLLSGGRIDPSAIEGLTELVPAQQVEFTAEEQELASFSKKILAGTEDVWSAYFEQNGLGTYEAPSMVLYTGATSSGCGTGRSSMGPFYCSADRTVYIDLSFFTQMKANLGADGDFAYAYVIAHEVGHHVQNLLGVLSQVHSQMSASDKVAANQLSVRLELFADFLAGMWAYHDNRMFGSLEEGDIEEALRCAEVIGDNYLQQKANGYVVEDSFTHGTSQQRMKWLKKGLSTGDLSKAEDIFSLNYRRL
ncbi:MAG: neutral zinc metallopeptidase [Candidatus Cryptobacteroides sp.]|nr:neutral zinc metallopeptidase [Bacteroidales bacterium]MDD6052448.1 neutral zinc metallopeptidase [Bacteroidales bacterium]